MIYQLTTIVRLLSLRRSVLAVRSASRTATVSRVRAVRLQPGQNTVDFRGDWLPPLDKTGEQGLSLTVSCRDLPRRDDIAPTTIAALFQKEAKGQLRLLGHTEVQLYVLHINTHPFFLVCAQHHIAMFCHDIVVASVLIMRNSYTSRILVSIPSRRHHHQH